MSILRRLFELEIVVQQDTRRHDASLVSSKESSRTGLITDTVDQVVVCSLDRLTIVSEQETHGKQWRKLGDDYLIVGSIAFKLAQTLEAYILFQKHCLDCQDYRTHTGSHQIHGVFLKSSCQYWHYEDWSPDRSQLEVWCRPKASCPTSPCGECPLSSIIVSMHVPNDLKITYETNLPSMNLLHLCDSRMKESILMSLPTFARFIGTSPNSLTSCRNGSIYSG